jgi:FecR protein
MKNNARRRRFSCFAVFVAVCASMLFALTSVEARGSSGSRPIGTIIGWGTYAVDKMPAPAGTLLFAGDVVTTGEGSGAEMRLVSGAIARIGAGSEVHLGAGDFDLRLGKFTLRSSAGKPAHARVLGAGIVVGTGSPAICRLEARATSAVVAADRGIVVIEGPVPPLVLAAGRAAQLEEAPGQTATLSGSPLRPARVTAISAGIGQAPSGPASSVLPEDLRAAGRVVGSYPDAEVRHPGSPIAVPIRLGEIVDIGDMLGTMAGGRVRVQLLDNTLFDLGISTTLSVLRHDPDKHSTELDLHEGHLHADIGAPDGSQPSFRVRTPIMQVSASPTMLFVSADTKEAVVCSAGSGPVIVRNSSGGAPVTLAAGQCSVTRAGESPGPARSDAARLQREMELATFESGPGIPELAHARATRQARTTIDASLAVLNAVALVEIQHAASRVKKVNLNSLTSKFNDLSNSADAAAEAARNLCLALLNFTRVPSPSNPNNACGSTGP